MKIKFCGAAKEVTGSNHLLEVGDKKILLDCGIFQGGDRDVMFEKNQKFLFNPKEIDAVVISHAHQDHTGRLPILVKQGFTGKIYCTEPTVDLCRVMLADSAALQKQDAYYYAKHFKKQVEPLFSEDDVEKLLNLLEPKKYKETFEVTPGISCSFFEAGHVLGSAQVYLEIKDHDKLYRLAFTGDLGRKYMPILNDPAQIPEADFLITESTYASHVHDSFSYVYDELKWLILDVVNRGGKIIIPGFSLERTQELIYVLHKLYVDKQIPELPVFVDSPLSTKISQVFMKYSNYYDDQSMRDFLGRASSPFAFEKLKYTPRKEDSQKLNSFQGSCIIIAGSGMCTGGRILHHLKHHISNPNNLILIVGYMAKGTLGRRLIEKKREIKIFNEYFEVKADVVALNEFSGHADKLELLENIKNIKNLKQIFVAHGEDLETSVMRDNIYNILKFKGRVDIPDFGEEYLIHNGTVESAYGEKTAKYLQQLQAGKDTESY